MPVWLWLRIGCLLTLCIVEWWVVTLGREVMRMSRGNRMACHVSPRFPLNSVLLLTLPTSISLNLIPIYPGVDWERSRNFLLEDTHGFPDDPKLLLINY
jgi:hypothetical protein